MLSKRDWPLVNSLTSKQTGRTAVILLMACLAASVSIIGLPAPSIGREDGEVEIQDPSLLIEERLIDEGSFSAARARLDKLQVERPDDVNVKILAARFFRKIGLWSVAIMEYEKVRRVKPEIVEPYIALSEMHRENLSTEIALAMAEEAVARAPQSVRAREALISALIDNHNVSQAQAELLALNKARPTDPEVLYLSFKVKKALGELEQARIDLEKAMKLSPNNVAWYFDLSEIYEDTGDYQQARATIGKYIEASPDSTRALAKLAEILEFRLYDLDGAKQIYDRILVIEPDNQSALAGKDRLLKKRNDLASTIKRNIYKFFAFIVSIFSSKKVAA
ncbi:tetratricopeptide repeat protein [Candidatus Obscuribacterales bacterium]|nr:tetratricopeptide repeat protein [Candidatus Obscuribacterales bacterium]MBX3150760.1 tetratricopeptide repeat protein [Candidatus Obscuribacterales bacterium]